MMKVIQEHGNLVGSILIICHVELLGIRGNGNGFLLTIHVSMPILVALTV